MSVLGTRMYSTGWIDVLYCCYLFTILFEKIKNVQKYNHFQVWENLWEIPCLPSKFVVNELCRLCECPH